MLFFLHCYKCMLWLPTFHKSNYKGKAVVNYLGTYTIVKKYQWTALFVFSSSFKNEPVVTRNWYTKGKKWKNYTFCGTWQNVTEWLNHHDINSYHAFSFTCNYKLILISQGLLNMLTIYMCTDKLILKTFKNTLPLRFFKAFLITKFQRH